MSSPGLEKPRLGPTLLIVDDDSDHREALDQLLSHEGFRVTGCSNGRQALDWLRVGRPDLILLDLKMPAIDGLQFRAAQKEDPAISGIPVIALSADPTTAIDADAHLKKPFDPKMLVATVGDLLLAREDRELQSRIAQTDRLASLGTLAAGVAHEINNPLAYVLLNIDYARSEVAEFARDSGGDRGREVRLALDRVSEGAWRIRDIVRGLRTFSRPESETTAPLQLAKVLEATLAMIQNEIRHEARLVREFEPVPDVVGNEARLGQVFLNLLMNALQALPEGRAAQNEIRVVVRSPTAEFVVVEVHDNGAGIPAGMRAQIFEPFFTTKPIGVGTGLGLAICHGIVTSLGGTISVESEPGFGSIFRVELPAAPSTAGATATLGVTDPPPQLAPPTVRGRILVIDDEPMVCSSLVRMLAGEGDVVAVPSAREALDRIASGERFDVLLCDVMMPGMDAPALHDELCKVAAAQADRMVFMTGGAFTTRAREFLERVPNARVDKPFDVVALRSLVRARVSENVFFSGPGEKSSWSTSARTSTTNG
jgi:signal transduction histidine kinase